jgi:hypothetical protein
MILCVVRKFGVFKFKKLICISEKNENLMFSQFLDNGIYTRGDELFNEMEFQITLQWQNQRILQSSVPAPAQLD